MPPQRLQPKNNKSTIKFNVTFLYQSCQCMYADFMEWSSSTIIHFQWLWLVIGPLLILWIHGPSAETFKHSELIPLGCTITCILISSRILDDIGENERSFFTFYKSCGWELCDRHLLVRLIAKYSPLYN